MPSHLTEVCRAGSACLSTLAHSAGPAPSRTDVYRPEVPASENGFLDVLFSVQTLIAIAILALGLFLVTTWSNRREARHRKTQAMRPPVPPEH
ncbi:hypothetical protein [Streptomyces sp. NPDC048473]|uniref:hypothetical protein n=1 Tax=unclassified Streptomyces TaxID=2593676 RepID=UPI0037248B58